MEAKKTHIFLKENKHPGFDEKSPTVIRVLECRIPGPNLAIGDTSIYFEEVKVGPHKDLQMITKEDFEKLNEETLKFIEKL